VCMTQAASLDMWICGLMTVEGSTNLAGRGGAGGQFLCDGFLFQSLASYSAPAPSLASMAHCPTRPVAAQHDRVRTVTLAHTTTIKKQYAPRYDTFLKKPPAHVQQASETKAQHSQAGKMAPFRGAAKAAFLCCVALLAIHSAVAARSSEWQWATGAALKARVLGGCNPLPAEVSPQG
jgi:hypothetical protein